MAEAAQQHQEEEEKEQQQQQSTVEETEPNEGSEEPKEVQTRLTRPLLSMSSVDPDDDSPNMIVYRKVRTKNDLLSLSLWYC